MGGGLMELVAYGAQDIYLTGNPQITFFKVVYRRHTNFAKEPVEVPFGGSVGPGKKVTVTVPRHGDLINQVWIEVDVGATAAAAAKDAEGFSLIKNVEVEIGGQKIDKQDYRFMHGYLRNSKSTDEIVPLSSLTKIASGGSKIMIPLQFWFCRNVGLALPLIALQYHEVKINVEFAQNVMYAGDVSGSSTHVINSASLWIDYIYLDTDERRRFAQVSHEYLIEQVQVSHESLATNSGPTEKTTNIDMTFKHPVKYLMWYLGNAEDTLTTGTAPNLASDIYLTAAKIQLNGHDRIPEKSGDYFGNYQLYQCGLGNQKVTPVSVQAMANVTAGSLNNLEGIAEAVAATGGTSGVKYYMYSFALQPQEHQPSGTCNFSRIDNARLILKHKCTHSTNTASSSLHVYGVNYNVLRIMSGMGGLAYSN